MCSQISILQDVSLEIQYLIQRLLCTEIFPPTTFCWQHLIQKLSDFEMAKKINWQDTRMQTQVWNLWCSCHQNQNQSSCSIICQLEILLANIRSLCEYFAKMLVLHNEPWNWYGLIWVMYARNWTNLGCRKLSHKCTWMNFLHTFSGMCHQYFVDHFSDKHFSMY